MPILSEELHRQTVRVSTPNEQLHAVLTWPEHIEVTIDGGYAERMGDRETSTQLSRLARLMFAARAQTYERVKDEVLAPNTARIERPRDTEFRDRYEQLSVEVSSRDGSVTGTCVGLQHWNIDVASGAADRIGSAGIARASTEVANELVARLKQEVRDLRHDVYQDHE